MSEAGRQQKEGLASVEAPAKRSFSITALAREIQASDRLPPNVAATDRTQHEADICDALFVVVMKSSLLSISFYSI